jgi:hypothetical protein
MKSIMLCFEMWKALMTSNASNMFVHQSMFWNYLNYSYLKFREQEWYWGDR